MQFGSVHPISIKINHINSSTTINIIMTLIIFTCAVAFTLLAFAAYDFATALR